jgi:MFS family permease
MHCRFRNADIEVAPVPQQATWYVCVFRYDLGLVGGALLKIRLDLHISDTEQAWIVGITKAGAILGTYIGAAGMYKYGRSRAIGHISVFFLAGPLLMASAGTVLQLVAGRLVTGLGVGASAVVVPAFLAEMAPPALRGLTVISYECMICIGMLASLLVDAAFEVCPPFVMFLERHVCFLK